jgi:glycosyltransferase involved in cell wall biosynthesis
MASGRPVICLDLGGPALQITEETGFKIPPHTPEQVVKDMVEAMQKLALDADLRRRMGEAGRWRVGEAFSWECRAGFIANIYSQIVNAKVG